VTPDQGSVTIAGVAVSSDSDPVKRRLGLVPQDLALYDELTARQSPAIRIVVRPVWRSARSRH